jgi:hypothetical protein
LQLIHSANPSLTGWPIWLISQSFTDEKTHPYPYQGTWEQFIQAPGFSRYHLDFMIFSPKGEFYFARALEDDTREKKAGPETPKTVEPIIQLWRVAEALAAGKAFASVLGESPEELKLFYETPVGVQMHDGRGKNHQAYLWQYSRPGGVVIFDFQLGRGREGPKQFLGHFNGILQTDGYSGYDRVGGPKLIHAGCWAHARRYFFQAVEAQPDDRAAIALVATIADLDFDLLLQQEPRRVHVH